eukprot:TRINITY_DN2638_c3_g1_i1.p1 TRINITY_DN2638_c3_g1~~TRINITY_DN2638_c3_g1_i1.p1  ORF type:complete len:478 (-),score=149.45 TRINITY_DN2638_c3_g1_i1:185-1618(-)
MSNNDLVVLDIGSCTTRIGYGGGSETPELQFPTLLFEYQESLDTKKICKIANDKYSVGFERKLQNPSYLNKRLITPVVDGVVKEWKFYEKLVKYSFWNLLQPDKPKEEEKPKENNNNNNNNNNNEEDKIEEIDMTDVEDNKNESNNDNSGEKSLEKKSTIVVDDEEMKDKKNIKKSKNEEDNELSYSYLVQYDQKKLLLSDSVTNPRSNKELITQLIFEGQYPVYQFSLVDQGLLSLYGSGNTSGTVVHSGYETTYIMPFVEAQLQPEGMICLPFGGKTVSNYLTEILSNNPNHQNIGESVFPLPESVVHHIKKRFCTTALNYEEIIDKPLPKQQYKLSKGRGILSIGPERYNCAESLFDPYGILGTECIPIHEAINSSIHNCDIDKRDDLMNNIILSGGNTMFGGIEKRLEKELREISPNGYDKTTVTAIEDRNNLPYIGGSVLSSLTTFKNYWISKSEYDEYGPNVINQRRLIIS